MENELFGVPYEGSTDIGEEIKIFVYELIDKYDIESIKVEVKDKWGLTYIIEK